MTIETDFFTAQMGRYPFPVSYCADGKTIRGICEEDALIINGQEIPLGRFDVCREDGRYTLSCDGYAVVFELRVDRALHYTAYPAKASRPVEYIGFSKLPFFRVDGSFGYARDQYVKQQWHTPIGRGLSACRFETGVVSGVWPQEPAAAVHACAFAGNVCCFTRTDYAVYPLTVAFGEDSRFPCRSGEMTIGLNRLWFDLRDKQFERWQFSIHLIGDLNGDGKADECDYQLALREYLPDPNPIYRNAVWYKIMCDVNGRTFTTFAQALEIIAYISRITHNAKQIVYLVGWQDCGHDSNYPSFNRINPALGTRDDLIRLIQEAKERYHCTVSVHINVDDAYPHNPGWREDLISRDIDGEPMKWEVFCQKQSYHINHTKDVRSGDIFRRLDEFLALVPVTESIHIDAFRNTNYSWEEDEFIGPDKEFYCGQKEIIAYLNRRGIDVTTEALNGMVIEAAGTFSGLYHMFPMLPVLYHNKIYGGGGDGSAARTAIGASINADFVYDDLQQRASVLHRVVMQNMLYRYLLGKKMVEHRTEGKSGYAYVRYADGTIARGDNSCDYLEITTADGMTVATNTSRMIPLDGGLYVFQTAEGWLRGKLPGEMRGKPLTCKVIAGGTEWPDYRIDGDRLHVYTQANTLMYFQIDRTRL